MVLNYTPTLSHHGDRQAGPPLPSKESRTYIWSQNISRATRRPIFGYTHSYSKWNSLEWRPNNVIIESTSEGSQYMYHVTLNSSLLTAVLINEENNAVDSRRSGCVRNVSCTYCSRCNLGGGGKSRVTSIFGTKKWSYELLTLMIQVHNIESAKWMIANFNASVNSRADSTYTQE